MLAITQRAIIRHFTLIRKQNKGPGRIVWINNFFCFYL